MNYTKQDFIKVIVDSNFLDFYLGQYQIELPKDFNVTEYYNQALSEYLSKNHWFSDICDFFKEDDIEGRLKVLLENTRSIDVDEYHNCIDDNKFILPEKQLLLDNYNKSIHKHFVYEKFFKNGNLEKKIYLSEFFFTQFVMCLNYSKLRFDFKDDVYHKSFMNLSAIEKLNMINLQSDVNIYLFLKDNFLKKICLEKLEEIEKDTNLESKFAKAFFYHNIINSGLKDKIIKNDIDFISISNNLLGVIYLVCKKINTTMCSLKLTSEFSKSIYFFTLEEGREPYLTKEKVNMFANEVQKSVKKLQEIIGDTPEEIKEENVQIYNSIFQHLQRYIKTKELDNKKIALFGFDRNVASINDAGEIVIDIQKQKAIALSRIRDFIDENGFLKVKDKNNNPNLLFDVLNKYFENINLMSATFLWKDKLNIFTKEELVEIYNKNFEIYSNSNSFSEYKEGLYEIKSMMEYFRLRKKLDVNKEKLLIDRKKI